MARRLADGTTYEIIHLPSESRNGYYNNIQIAVDGLVCWPFNLAACDFHRYPKDRLIPMLVRQAQSLIDLYGDVRKPRKFVEAMGMSLRECMSS